MSEENYDPYTDPLFHDVLSDPRYRGTSLDPFAKDPNILKGKDREIREITTSGQWQNVQSSNVGAINYHYDSEQLYVYYTHGGWRKDGPNVYVYFAVPLYIAEAFYRALSKGTFTHKYLRGRFTYNKLGAGYYMYF